MYVLQSPPDAVVTIDRREYLYFVGTGYLGLQNHPEVIGAACLATERYGIHSATTRAGFGNSPPVLEAERRAAELYAAEAAFYFAAGYAGNAVLMNVLQERFDLLLIDELSHFSVVEAARQSRLPARTFRHRDADDLAATIARHIRPGMKPLLLTDGVFSVRGTIAPLTDYRQELSRYAGAGMMIDDAHAVGVLGLNGRGTPEHFGLPNAVNSNVGPLPAACNQADSDPRLPTSNPDDVSMFLTATASKALGGFGGIIPGSREFIELVRRSSHWFDGASAPPAGAAAATAKAVEIVMADADRRARLHANVHKMKHGLRGLGFDADDSPVPIVLLRLGDAENMRRIQSELMRRGVAVAYLSAYSGLDAEGGLRIAVFTTHTDAMIERLIDELRRVV